MFREMRRFRQAVPQSECRRLLREEKRAAFSLNGENGYPYTIPINFWYEEEENRIYFHGAREGYKADAMRRSNQVCFTVWNSGFRTEGHWEWNVTSVVVFGRVSPVTDRTLGKARLHSLALKYYPTAAEADAELSSAFDRVQMFCIEIEHMTGKLVREK